MLLLLASGHSVSAAFALIKKTMEKPITILLSCAERKIILRYGYPFEDIESQLTRAGDCDLIQITDVPFWWERVVVNLHISENENQTNGELALVLRALIDKIAAELNTCKQPKRTE